MTHVFRQYDIRGVVDSDLSIDFVADLGKAIAAFFKQRKVETVSLGFDCRLSSIPFHDRLVESFVTSGLTVYDIGMVPTPIVYFSLFNLPVDGGVMITGSHNPPNENGFKICLGKSTIFGEDIQEIGRIMDERRFISGQGRLIERSLIPDYLSYVQKIIHPGPKPLKVVVDAGNGTGNLTSVPLYRSLGWEVIELYSEPDGNFPHHHPDPTVPAYLVDLKAKVAEIGADLGIALDGDADRIGVIDAKGRTLWGDQLLQIYAAEILQAKPGAKIIGEVKCSQKLFDRIRELGGVPIMWKVGHSLLKAKMKEEQAVLAGEMSGHLFFADRYYGYDDAVYSGARLLEILSHSTKSLVEMVDALPKTYATPEIRFECPDDRKFQVVRDLTEHFRKEYQVIDIDGARIIFPDGWGLVRASNTQPVLVLRFEADSQTALTRIEAEVRAELDVLVK
ncbi:MAG TPA: phosphomannomutase/phosphoglucomutase [Bacillota bacterium]